MMTATGRILICLALTLAINSPVFGVGTPMQARSGLVRLGSFTVADVNPQRSTVTISEGMVLVSSNTGGFGRPIIRVDFVGAPMWLKVQGTAVVAYLPGQHIQVSELEGRSVLARVRRMGERITLNAGEMVLVNPKADRLPDAVDFNIERFVRSSPILNSGLRLKALPLIEKEIARQQKKGYLEATPIVFNGAGTEAEVVAESLDRSQEDEAYDEAAGAGTAVSAVERRNTEVVVNTVNVLEQLERLGESFNPPNGGGDSDRPPPRTAYEDIPGATRRNSVAQNEPNTGFAELGTIGFLEEHQALRGFTLQIDPSMPNEPPTPIVGDDGNEIFNVRSRGLFFPDNNKKGVRIFLPATTSADNVVRRLKKFANILVREGEGVGIQLIPKLDTRSEASINEFLKLSSFPRFLGEVTTLANILSDNSARTITVLRYPQANLTSSVDEARFRLTRGSAGSSTEVEIRFSQDDIPSHLLDPDRKNASEFASLFIDIDPNDPPTGDLFKEDPFSDNSAGERPTDPPKNLRTMKLKIPKEGVTISDPFFLGDSLTRPGGELVGLREPLYMGSVLARPLETSTTGVLVEVNDGIGTRANPIKRFSFNKERGYGSLLSVQASQGFKPSNRGMSITSKGPIEIREADFSAAPPTKLTVSSPKKISFKNSTEVRALSKILMRGNSAEGAAKLEIGASTVKANRRILLDHFKRIHITNAELAASVVKARAIGPDGVLHIRNSILGKVGGTLVRLYANGVNGTVEFEGIVNLTGRQIDIAGNTVRVTSGGSVIATGDTTVYANRHKYDDRQIQVNGSKIAPEKRRAFGDRPAW